MSIKLNLDALGIAASIACAIHCAVLPLIVSSLPILGINIIHNRAFEFGMILLAFCVGSYSLAHGYRKHHGRFAPFLLFSVGIGILLAKQQWHQYELWFLPFAVVFIIAAHILNFRLCRISLHKKPKTMEEIELEGIPDFKNKDSNDLLLLQDNR
ncbi:MAG TPA: MerC domain-containing protein [Puia sp.]|nr:MerC domain-containing protein [Puia sp.]